MDEATSAMDNLTEENVMKSVMLKMKDKTVIAIAHRLNSIAGFDRIILFREGKIVGQGTFEELLHTDSSGGYAYALRSWCIISQYRCS